MRIDRRQGKRLIAVLEEDAAVDMDVCRAITDLCRRRKVTQVALVYPLRRIEEIRGFMAEVQRITGRPCQGFSHDSPGLEFSPLEVEAMVSIKPEVQ